MSGFRAIRAFFWREMIWGEHPIHFSVNTLLRSHRAMRCNARVNSAILSRIAASRAFFAPASQHGPALRPAAPNEYKSAVSPRTSHSARCRFALATHRSNSPLHRSASALRKFALALHRSASALRRFASALRKFASALRRFASALRRFASALRRAEAALRHVFGLFRGFGAQNRVLQKMAPFFRRTVPRHEKSADAKP
jgi:hypothetical protein